MSLEIETQDNAPVEVVPVQKPKRRYTKPEPGSKKREKILELAAKGVIKEDIVTLTGFSPTTVSRTLKRFSKVFKNLKEVDVFRNVKADILDAATLTALESAMTPSKLAKASFISSVTGAQMLDKMSRLERGQSTENHAHAVRATVTINNTIDDALDE